MTAANLPAESIPMVDESWFCRSVKESTSLDVLTVSGLVDWCSRQARANGSPFKRIYERRYNAEGEGIGPRMEISLAASHVVLEVALAMSRARAAAFAAACPPPSPPQARGSDDCPAWCDAHNGFDDGSDDWHQSSDCVAGGRTFYVSTGTHSGQPEVFTVGPSPESMTLDETEAFARALLTAVAATRAEVSE